MYSHHCCTQTLIINEVSIPQINILKVGDLSNNKISFVTADKQIDLNALLYKLVEENTTFSASTFDGLVKQLI